MESLEELFLAYQYQVNDLENYLKKNNLSNEDTEKIIFNLKLIQDFLEVFKKNK